MTELMFARPPLRALRGVTSKGTSGSFCFGLRWIVIKGEADSGDW